MASGSSFSNTEKQVFILKMQSALDRGALLSRYSRTSSLDIRELYAKEFENNPLRGKEFYERVFVEYGDESVAELVTVQVAIQDVSNVVSKIIEESRVGLSYLEKSSRYVSYSKKRDGKFLYLEFQRTGLDKSLESEYSNLMDTLFQYYSEAIDPIREHLRIDFPLERSEVANPETIEKAYSSAVRARALDDARSFLPSATLTNIGISGNIRSFIYLIQRLYASGIPEASDIATLLLEELSQEYEELMKSTKGKHGDQSIDYMRGVGNLGEKNNQIIEDHLRPQSQLINYAKENLLLLGTYMRMHFNLPEEPPLKDIVNVIAGLRQNRRNKLPRQLEFVTLTYKINMNYGAFREFQRHRFMSIIRSEVGMENGFQIPEYVKRIPAILERYNSVMNAAGVLWRKAVDLNGRKVAQVVVPFGVMYPIIVSTNLRELVYFCELRSTAQSHPDLRFIAHDMMKQIIQQEPDLEPLFRFVDREDYPLGRFNQEYKKEEKLHRFNGIK